MAVSVSDLIPRVRTFLDERPLVSTGTATNGTTTNITVTDNADWEVGAILEFQDNGEQCLVQSAAANPITVVRGWNGTTAAAHSSITVFRDPQYTYKNINERITSAVQRLWPYAWKVSTKDITPDPTNKVWYDLDATFMDMVNAAQLYGATSENVGLFGEKGTGRAIVVAKNLPTALVTSGKGVKFPQGFFHASNTVKVTYRAVITGTSDIEDSGSLPVADAVIYGALAGLLTGKEIERLTVGEDAEVARSVRAGARLGAAGYYSQLFQEKLEWLRLLHERLYPPQPHWSS